jgi:hypothetical protein
MQDVMDEQTYRYSSVEPAAHLKQRPPESNRDPAVAMTSPLGQTPLNLMQTRRQRMLQRTHKFAVAIIAERRSFEDDTYQHKARIVSALVLDFVVRGMGCVRLNRQHTEGGVCQSDYHQRIANGY